MLRDGEWHHLIQMLRSGMSLTGPFIPVLWLMRIGSEIPTVRTSRDLNKMIAWCAQQMDDRIEV